MQWWISREFFTLLSAYFNFFLENISNLIIAIIKVTCLFRTFTKVPLHFVLETLVTNNISLFFTLTLFQRRRVTINSRHLLAIIEIIWIYFTCTKISLSENYWIFASLIELYYCSYYIFKWKKTKLALLIRVEILKSYLFKHSLRVLEQMSKIIAA